MWGLPLVAVSGVYSSVVVHRLLAAVTHPIAKHMLLGTWASVVVIYGLSCPKACRIFLDEGSNPCFLHWQADP